jgi:23S rRNA pseudouridine2605 synthase
MILIKFVAKSGILSRRKSEEAIKTGLVKVNGSIKSDPTYIVENTDVVFFNNKKIIIKGFTYILINKPNQFLTSKQDPSGLPLITNLLPIRFKQNLDPVGRLDFNTSGALLMTDDGELAYNLSHPKFNIRKTYAVIASRAIDKEIIENLKKGIYLDDGMVQADKILWNEKSPHSLTITLHGGKYRIIRRLLETFNIFVKKLHRVQFGSLHIRKLPLGSWRHLEEKELTELKKIIEQNKVNINKKNQHNQK